MPCFRLDAACLTQVIQIPGPGSYMNFRANGWLGSSFMMYDRWQSIHGFGLGFGPLGGLILGLLIILPFWQIFTKAGFSGWWSLLMLVPGVNVVVLYVLAFVDWPGLRQEDRTGRLT